MYGLLFLLFQSVCLSLASQLENLKNKHGIVNIGTPRLDFPGEALQLFGGFNALTFPQYEGQENFTGTINNNTDSRGIVYYSNDTFIKLINGSSDSYVEKIVPFGSESFILGGSGSLLGYELGRQLLYNLSDLSLRPIFENSLTDVRVILEDYPVAYFGGNFSFDNGSTVGHSVATWNSSSNTTSLLPFGGFGEESIVNSIIKLDSDNILFTGEFYTLDDQTLLITNENTSKTNHSQSIEINELLPLRAATWNTDSDSSFDSSAFICPNSQKEAWSVPSTSGSLEASLPYESYPKKVRIYNSPEEHNAVSLFRIITKPSNGIMNLTYVDPLSGELLNCDAFCPLMLQDSLKAAVANGNTSQVVRLDNNLTDIQWSYDYQDFAFVNKIAVTDLQFLALSSYGDAVGLSSFQLYQDTLTTYANNSLNEVGCESNDIASTSALSDSEWKQGLFGQSYLVADFRTGQETLPKVTFYPAINYAGQYTMNLYTPGCSSDQTCTSRSIVNVTMWSEVGGSILSSILLHQNNEAMKYDQVYSGHLETAPVLTLEYYSPISPNNPSNVVVADRLEIIVESVDILKNQTDETIPLNGMFQYQLSNFTNSTDSIPSIANTTLNSYTVQNFPKNASLFSSMYNDTLWVGGSVSGVAAVELDEDLHVSSTAKYATGGTVEGISSYSDGIILFGTFNLSSQPVSTLTFNGVFGSFGNLETTLRTYTNVSFQQDELLVFNNEYVFNLSSNSYISNSSTFGLSLWSAGRNQFDDTLFSGAVTKNQFPGLYGSASIYSNSSVAHFSLQNGAQPYAACHLNDSVTAYAYRNGSVSQLYFDNGKEGPWTWFGTINSMRYSKNSTILAIGTDGSTDEPILSLFNLTSFDVLANTTISENGTISSMVFFDRNSSLLVGGDYHISDADCSGLCLYNYDQKQWTKFANNSITGNITEMQLSESYDLLISGAMNVANKTSVNLLSFNMSNYEVNPLVWDSNGPIKSFIAEDNDIITWNETSLSGYSDGDWQNFELDNSSLISIVDVIAVKTEPVLDKRQTFSSTFDAILVAGQNYAEYPQASIYNFQRWLPYYVANKADDEDPSRTTFFTNQDDSQLYDSQNLLSDPTRTTTSSSSSTTSSSQTSPSKGSLVRKSGKINRGFVVLIGLALALGTVVIIGITGVLLALVFNGHSGYEQVDPRADESEMIDTVPPEKLLKFL